MMMTVMMMYCGVSLHQRFSTTWCCKEVNFTGSSCCSQTVTIIHRAWRNTAPTRPRKMPYNSALPLPICNSYRVAFDRDCCRTIPNTPWDCCPSWPLVNRTMPGRAWCSPKRPKPCSCCFHRRPVAARNIYGSIRTHDRAITRWRPVSVTPPW